MYLLKDINNSCVKDILIEYNNQVRYSVLNEMRRLLLLLFSVVIISCISKKSNEETQISANNKTVSLSAIKDVLTLKKNDFPFETNASTLSYDSTLALLQIKKMAHKKALAASTITIDSVCQFFNESLVNDIIPYWYGTTWDFNGHTDTPNDGLIACGYFVSTTLRHLELKLNRFKLAQQASLNIVKSLACGTKVWSYSNPDDEKMVAEIISTLDDGVYVVGLSNHVGFLYLMEGELYLLHSTFLEPGEVIAEKALESDAFLWSDVYYLSSVSHNEKLMKKWLNGEQLTIIGS